MASPSTSGSRGGEQAMPLRDQRGAYTMAGHGGSAQAQLYNRRNLQSSGRICGGDVASHTSAGLSPAHSRSFTSGLSEGRSLTPAQSAGFAG